MVMKTIPLYLFIGMVVLGLSVAIPAIIGMIRKWTNLPKTEAHQPHASRLRILSAYYGVDGGPDSDVADKYLRARLLGRALAGWVGADLFGTFDPEIGRHKRLKVRYSFDGREAIIERCEGQLLVLPEDPLLKKQADEEAWKISSGQVPNYLLDSLQLEALEASRALRSFLLEIGPMPQLKTGDFRDTLEALKSNSEAVSPWYDKLWYGYERNAKKALRKRSTKAQKGSTVRGGSQS